MSAEPGVGPAIASGSHTWSGNWALLPIAPRKNNSVHSVSVGPTQPPVSTSLNTVSNWKLLAAHHMTTSARPKPQGKPKTTFLGNGVRFEGDIRTRGDLKINGQMQGRIHSREGVVVLGADAKIKAKVALRDFVVAGSFEGTVESARKIEVRSTGRLHGDLCTRRLLLEEGAIVEGKVHMKEA